MVEKGCRALCVGLGIHYPYYVNTRFSPGEPGGRTPAYFATTRREEFREYLHACLLPAVTCALEWLDDGHHLSFSVSGVVLEQLVEENNGAIDSLVQALRHPGSEVLGQTYHHSVAGLFADKSEFSAQVTRHAALMEEISGKKPEVFENTEFAFQSGLAERIRDLGFLALYTEGYDHLVSGQQPTALHTCRGLPVLLRNCRLSEDLAFRFFDQSWDQYPLTAGKYAGWVAATPGDCTHVFIDSRTFTGKGEDPGGFRDFFCHLPDALLEAGVETFLPSASLQFPPGGELQLEDIGLCLPDSSNCLTGIQNILQQSAFWCLEDGRKLVADTETWRRLQSTDHFIRMAQRSGSCGRVVENCTSDETREYFSAYLRVLSHIESAGAGLRSSELVSRALRCVPPEYAFHFHYPESRYTGYSAHSLAEFGRLLEFVPGPVFSFHLDRGDFCRWIADVFGDDTLAVRLAGCTDPAGARVVVEGRVRELCGLLR